MEPIHFLKKYYGEKFAFIYLFFNHYVAYLTLPAFFGVFMLLIQVNVYLNAEGKTLFINGVEHADRTVMNTILDSEFNGIFGIGLAIWSTFFVETWRSRQNMLCYEWDLNIIQDKYAGLVR